mmetsp:Transcript_11193/g.33150  ORF Transcript_11193/g.33150 Transcript_11193/m.33150 type:complete len:94 (-) Transcript_11193:642-923(-)
MTAQRARTTRWEDVWVLRWEKRKDGRRAVAKALKKPMAYQKGKMTGRLKESVMLWVRWMGQMMALQTEPMTLWVRWMGQMLALETEPVTLLDH